MGDGWAIIDWGAGRKMGIFEATCADAQWALMPRFASVCDWTKITGLKLLDSNLYIVNRLPQGHHLMISFSQNVIPSTMVYNSGRWAHVNVKLHFLKSGFPPGQD